MSGWDEWEQHESEAPQASTTAKHLHSVHLNLPRLLDADATASTDSDSLQGWPDEPALEPLPTGRRGTAPAPRKLRRAAKKAKTKEQRLVSAHHQARDKRALVTSLAHLRGTVMLIGSVVFIGVLIVLTVGAKSTKQTAATPASDPVASAPSGSPASGSTAAPVTATGILDPAAGRKVLPPQSMPAAPPPKPAIDYSSAFAVASAFAQQACAHSVNESKSDYAARLAPYAIATAAKAWPQGTASLTRCMQFAVSPAPGGSVSDQSAMLIVSAVQVYQTDRSSQLNAYRWQVPLSMQRQPDGRWLVGS